MRKAKASLPLSISGLLKTRNLHRSRKSGKVSSGYFPNRLAYRQQSDGEMILRSWESSLPLFVLVRPLHGKLDRALHGKDANEKKMLTLNDLF